MQRFKSSSEMVRAQDLARRPLAEISGSERQRLLLAQAFLGRPRLLLLDEPLISLDPHQLRGQRAPFDEVAQREMIAQGQVVFVDVTAAWCMTCKVNELAVLDRDPVGSKLRDPGVVAMRADWTRPDPNITGYLQDFGRYGVPFNAVYGPGAPRGIALPELLTSDAVMGALRHAAAGPGRQWEAAE